MIIGEAALFTRRQQPLFQMIARGKCLHSGVKAALLPQSKRIGGSSQIVAEQLFVVVQRIELLGILFKQYAAEHEAQKRAVLRLQPEAD